MSQHWYYLGVVNAACVAASFAGPLLLQFLLNYLQMGGSDWTGLGAAVAMLLAALVSALLRCVPMCVCTHRLRS